MKSIFRKIGVALALAAFGLLSGLSASAADRITDIPSHSGLPSLNASAPDGTFAHFYPTAEIAAIRQKSGVGFTSNVTYHGGRTMQATNIYAIFWSPPKLQTGVATS